MKPLPALVQRILDNVEPQVTTDELKWLAEEYARLHAQQKSSEASIAVPLNREELREAVDKEQGEST